MLDVVGQRGVGAKVATTRSVNLSLILRDGKLPHGQITIVHQVSNISSLSLQVVLVTTVLEVKTVAATSCY